MAPAIGATMVKSSGRGCHFRGDQAVGYKAILWLRTAHRYSYELHGCSADVLYIGDRWFVTGISYGTECNAACGIAGHVRGDTFYGAVEVRLFLFSEAPHVRS